MFPVLLNILKYSITNLVFSHLNTGPSILLKLQDIFQELFC
jgi:hypothetical protein